MLDPDGNLVTSPKGIEKLAVDHYKKVLENQPILEKPWNIELSNKNNRSEGYDGTDF